MLNSVFLKLYCISLVKTLICILISRLFITCCSTGWLAGWLAGVDFPVMPRLVLRFELDVLKGFEILRAESELERNSTEIAMA